MLVAEDEAGALHENRGDLFFTASVENREPLCISGIIKVHVQVHPYERHEEAF